MSSRTGLVHTYCSFVSYIGTKFKGSQRQLSRRCLEKADTSSNKFTVQQALDDALFHIVPRPLYTAGRKILLSNDDEQTDDTKREESNRSTTTEDELTNQNDLPLESAKDAIHEPIQRQKKRFLFDDSDKFGYRTYISSRTDTGVCSTMNCFIFDLEHPFEKYYKPDTLTMMMNRFLIQSKFDLIVNKTIVFNRPSINYDIIKGKQYCYRLAILKPDLLKKSYITSFTFLNHHLNSNSDEEPSSDRLNEPGKALEFPEYPDNLNAYALYSYLPINELNRSLVLNSKYLANENNQFVEKQINIDRMKAATRLFYGKYDFTTFSTFDRKPNSVKLRSPYKTISRFEIKERDVYDDCLFDGRYQNFKWYDVYVQADGFLYNQIRRMMGAVLAHGFDLISLGDIQFMLDNPDHLNFHSKCILTPPNGLYLSRIEFKEEIEELLQSEEELVLKEDQV